MYEVSTKQTFDVTTGVIPTTIPLNSTAGQYIKHQLIELLEMGKLSKFTIDNLKDKEYCSSELKTSFPVLVGLDDDFEHKRYYVEPVIGRYRISSQWYEKHKDIFDEWRVKNRL